MSNRRIALLGSDEARLALEGAIPEGTEVQTLSDAAELEETCRDARCTLFVVERSVSAAEELLLRLKACAEAAERARGLLVLATDGGTGEPRDLVTAAAGSPLWSDVLIGAHDPGRLGPRIVVALRAMSLIDDGLRSSRALEERSLELTEANRRLTAMTTIDEETGVGNRRGTVGFLDREWRRSLRTRKPISILMVLVEGDGDDSVPQPCLLAVSRALVSGARRPPDYVGRYGRSRFAVILGETDGEAAELVAENLRDMVEIGERVRAACDESGGVRATVGVATAVADAETAPVTLLDAADAALDRELEGGHHR
jgi:diguanylate cyclase (GGDEF)-like protein